MDNSKNFILEIFRPPYSLIHLGLLANPEKIKLGNIAQP